MSLDKTLTEGRVRWHNKSWTTFYSTMPGNHSYATNFNDSDPEIQHLQLSKGANLFPGYPIRSHAACCYNLRKSLGVQANSLHALDIKGKEYRSKNMLLALILKKC